MITPTEEVIRVGGYVIFGFIMLPVYLMVLGWVVGKPRDFRTVAITMGYVIALLASIVAGLAVLGLVVGFVKAI